MTTLHSIMDLGDLDSSDWSDLSAEIQEIVSAGSVPSKSSLSPAAWVVRAKLIAAGQIESTATRNRQSVDAYRAITTLQKAA